MDSLYTNHTEEQVASASPVQLVGLLYGALTQNLRQALEHCRSGDHHGRALAISKAQSILLELSTTLRADAGGDLAERLRDLYGYMFSRVQQANSAVDPGAIEEVLKLAGILSDAWQTIGGADPVAEAPLMPPSVDARVYCLG